MYKLKSQVTEKIINQVKYSFERYEISEDNEIFTSEIDKKWICLLDDYLSNFIGEQGNKEIKYNFLSVKDQKENSFDFFSTFYIDLIQFTEKHLDIKLKDIDELHRDIYVKNNIKNDILNCIYEQLSYVCIRVLVQDLNEERLQKNLLGDTPEKRYEYYLNSILMDSNKKTRFFMNYPVLVRVIFETINNIINTSLEAITRFAIDKEELKKKFDFGESDFISSIDMQNGDTHNQGRNVLIFELISGKKIVYKPRCMSVDYNFQDLIIWINERTIGLKLKPITVINKIDYGWQEFIEYKSCSSYKEIENFYERQGMNICLLYMLNSTDFHFENLIANGEYPILIDLEGLIQNTNIKDEVLLDAHDIAFNKLLNSVISIGMLPLTYTKDKYLSFDYSGLGGQEGQEMSHDVFMIDNPYTDFMQIKKAKGLSEGSENRPYLQNKEEINVENFIPQIVKGFKDMYNLFLNNKRDLFAENGPIYKFKNDRTRIILRSTQIYATFLDSSYHPDYLKTAQERESLINILGVRNDKSERSKIIDFECKDILKGDIPYFFCEINKKSLYHPLEKIQSDFYKYSNFECLINKIKFINKNDLKDQVDLISISLLPTKEPHYIEEKNAKDYYSLSKNRPTINLKDKFVSISELIADELSNKAIHGEEDVTWIGLHHGVNNQTSLSPLDFDLYNGLLGIGLFYSQLFSINKKNENKIMAERVLNSSLKLLEKHGEPLPLSVFYGYGGYMYVLSNYASVFNNNEYLVLAKKIAGLAAEEIGKDEILDLMGGSAGFIILAINLYKKTGDKFYLNLADECGKVLLSKKQKMKNGIAWKSKEVVVPLSGLSHGSAGFSWALSYLYNFTKKSVYKEAYIESLNYENYLFDSVEKNWIDLREGNDSKGKFCDSLWCHGAAGIGMSRIMISEIDKSETIRNDIKIAINQTLNSGFGGSNCLCHGNLGNLDLLLLSGKTENNKEVIEISHLIGQKIAEEILKGEWGLNFSTGAVSPGLMLGKSGVGYNFLRLAFPEEVPSVLTLQIM